MGKNTEINKRAASGVFKDISNKDKQGLTKRHLSCIITDRCRYKKDDHKKKATS